MLLTQISMEKKKKKNYLLSDILVYSSLRNLVGKEYCSSCSVYMFLWRKKPCLPWGVGCFCLCCHPRPAIGACGYIVMSGPCLGSPSHLPSQGLAIPLKRLPFPSYDARHREHHLPWHHLQELRWHVHPWASAWATYRRPTSTHSPVQESSKQDVSEPLSPKGRPRAARQPGSISPAWPSDSWWALLPRPSATSHPAIWQGMGPFLWIDYLWKCDQLVWNACLANVRYCIWTNKCESFCTRHLVCEACLGFWGGTMGCFKEWALPSQTGTSLNFKNYYLYFVNEETKVKYWWRDTNLPESGTTRGTESSGRGKHTHSGIMIETQDVLIHADVYGPVCHCGPTS